MRAKLFEAALGAASTNHRMAASRRAQTAKPLRSWFGNLGFSRSLRVLSSPGTAAKRRPESVNPFCASGAAARRDQAETLPVPAGSSHLQSRLFERA